MIIRNFRFYDYIMINLKNIQTEIDASFLYKLLAENESDENVAAVFSAIGLFGIGAAITLFTGKSIWFSGMRQVIFGLIAAAITFGIGRLIGVSIAG